MSRVVRLVQDFEQWRTAARELIARRVPPESVEWLARAEDGDLFSSSMDAGLNAGSSGAPRADAAGAAQSSSAGAPALRVSRQLMDMLASAACFRAADRWAFLYKVLWRWQHGEHEVASAADPDGARLYGMVKAVHREEHDMHAYVRFRERLVQDDGPRFVAWFEPSHDVLPQVAQHFARRMGPVRWLIATPDASVLWDGSALHWGAAVPDAAGLIDDSGEALWLTYYRSIFNPARLNADLLRSHIPSRFWKNLPEGAIVPGMISAAANGARRTGQTASVGQRAGNAIPIEPERAQPGRADPTTLDQCRRCDLWKSATQAVAGVGPRRARIMLVGEQPGDQEDLAGLPFVGPAGAVLDRAMLEAGIDRETVYVTNAVKHFKWEPRGKRRLHKTPSQREVLACRLWLEEELEREGPAVVVALGSTALKSLLQDGSATMKAVLGQPFEHEGRWIVTVYHPSYILRAPDEQTRREAYQVLLEGLRVALRLAGEHPRG